LDVLKILLDAKANPNARDNTGNTPLHYAANLKRIDICSHLILNGAIAGILVIQFLL
jgi:ankyrin repeat protein